MVGLSSFDGRVAAKRALQVAADAEVADPYSCSNGCGADVCVSAFAQECRIDGNRMTGWRQVFQGV